MKRLLVIAVAIASFCALAVNGSAHHSPGHCRLGKSLLQADKQGVSMKKRVHKVLGVEKRSDNISRVSDPVGRVDREELAWSALSVAQQGKIEGHALNRCSYGGNLLYFTDFKNNSFGDIFMNRWQVAPAGNHWQPLSQTSPGWTALGGVPAITEVSTPYGPGFKFQVTSDMWQSASEANGKLALIADLNHLLPDASVIGSTQDWSGRFMLPSAGNVSGFPAQWRGVVWEFHTATMSGNNLNIDEDTGRLEWLIYDRATEWYTSHIDPNPIKLDHWYTWRLQIKWSHGSDGFAKGWLDGVLLADRTGPTLKVGESPYLQFGYYSGPGAARNEVIHAAIRKS